MRQFPTHTIRDIPRYSSTDSGKASALLGSFFAYFLMSLASYGLLAPLLSWNVFSADDSHIMRVAIDYGWFEHYLDPQVYRQLSVANYTPVSLTVCRIMLLIFGLSPIAYLWCSIIAVSLLSALAGLLTRELTKSTLAAWLVMLLIFSNLTMLTLLSRFYTIHYITGGIFALLSALLVLRGQILLPALFVFLALLCKEVYIALPFILFLYALYWRDIRLGTGIAVALLGYLALRSWILGSSVDMDASGSYFTGVWAIAPKQWLHFFTWYVKHKYLIVLVTLIAFVLSPYRMICLFPVVLALVAPTFIASHGVQYPEMHADRLFLAFDIALVISAVYVLKRSGYLEHYVKYTYLIPLALFVLSIHVASQGTYRESVMTGANFKVTRYIIDNFDSLGSRTIYVPIKFTQGDLMRVSDSLDGPSFLLTQNCLVALDQKEDSLIVFDSAGNLSNRKALQETCTPASPDINIEMAPQVVNGVLEWRLQSSEAFAAGVLFVDRALAVPVEEFAGQLAMPSPGERYQLFAFNDGHWWFSDVSEVKVLD